MIEAVGSSLVGTQSLRVNAGGVAPSITVGGGHQAPQAPYISPHISIDLAHNKAVIQIRDSDTGDVQQQFPTKSRLAQISQAQARLDNERSVKGADIPDAPRSDQKAASSVSATLPSSGIQSSDIVTVQDITSSSSANTSLPSPQVAAAALSATAQSTQVSASSSSEVSVLA